MRHCEFYCAPRMSLRRDGWALCSPTERRRNEAGQKPSRLSRSPEALHRLSSAVREPYARKPLDPLPNSGSQKGKKHMVS